MTTGSNLTTQKIRAAIKYNNRRFDMVFTREIQKHMGITPQIGIIDEQFVRKVATWQESNLGLGQGDGKIGSKTEAHLNIQLPEATKAVQEAKKIKTKGGILFDSWGNDLRDNNQNNKLDQNDPDEGGGDGSHNKRTYTAFKVISGGYRGGWEGERKNVQVRTTRVISGQFKYRVCADVVSEAYKKAGIMSHLRSTGKILGVFRKKGYVWRRSKSYPTKYLPGDFICTYAPGYGGHSAIVVEAGSTGGGRLPPKIIDLPGPSSSISDGIYDPARTNDVTEHKWPKRRLNCELKYQYLGRLLHSKLKKR